MIDWVAFFIVFLAAIVSTVVVVSTYSLGLRLLSASGRIPVVEPAEFTDAITVMSAKEIKTATKRARKAAKKNPLTAGQKQAAFIGAWACFVVCACAVLFGIYLIVPALHS
ncbi:peptidase [Microterricola pindariensis]|uniref:Peptidase n=1 Tax=Microterricola pindariensis TaxID=478010 RepID=A0ABX5ASP3_9MICO|nr:peptidase [Microterricola pindariensis]PPL15544.1 peptidase [Microterricola pindariensis]